MNWKQRSDGELDLTVLMGFELAAGEGAAIAARLEYAVAQEQLSGDHPPEAIQLIMTSAGAEALANELLAAVARARSSRLS